MSVVQQPPVQTNKLMRALRLGRDASQPQAPKKENDLAALLKIAVPSMMATVAGTVMSFVDFAFVSQLGSEAQAAVGNGSVLVWTLFGLGMGMGTAVSTFAAQALGQGKVREGAGYMWQGVYLAVVFAALSVALIPLVPWFWGLLGHPETVLHLETTYTRILLLASGPLVVAVAFSNYFNGIHRPMVVMISMIAANVLNVVADYCLIFGNWGFPAMGVAGAGWATVIAMSARCIWLLVALARPRFRREFQPFADWRYSASRMWSLLKVGTPVGLQWVADFGSWALFATWLIGRFGTADLAATHIVWKMLELSWMPAIGIGVGINAVVGKAIGQGDQELARRRARLGVAISIGYMGLMGAVFAIFRYPLIGWFTDDPAVFGLGVNLMLLAAAFQVFDAMSIAYGSALRGAGDTKWPAAALIVYCYGIMIAGGWALVVLMPGWGSYGPWLMSTIYAILLGFKLRGRWVRGDWKRIDIFAATAQQQAAVTAAAGEADGRDGRLQENGPDTQDPVPHEGQSRPAGAGLAEAVERDGPVRSRPTGPQRQAGVPAA